MASKPSYKVPYDEHGVLMHYARGWNGKTYYPVREPDIAWSYDYAAEWRDPEPFTATLRLADLSRGRSAAYFYWDDDEGRHWPMFMKELMGVVQEATIVRGVVRGSWIPVKRGQNFGLKYAGPA